MKRLILATMISLLIPISGVQAEESPDSSPNLTGYWTINEKLSDDLQQVMMKAMGGGRGGGKGGGGGHGGGGGGMGGGGRGGGMGGGGRGGGMGGGGRGGGMSGGGGDSSANNPQAQKRAEEMKQQYSRLEIFQDGDELNVTNGLDITRLLYTDGRTNTIWTQRGEAAATAIWEGSTLVIRWKTRQETLARVRYYSLDEEKKRLTVSEEIQIPNKDEVVKIRMVYDR